MNFLFSLNRLAITKTIKTKMFMLLFNTMSMHEIIYLCVFPLVLFGFCVFHLIKFHTIKSRKEKMSLQLFFAAKCSDVSGKASISVYYTESNGIKIKKNSWWGWNIENSSTSRAIYPSTLSLIQIFVRGGNEFCFFFQSMPLCGNFARNEG